MMNSENDVILLAVAALIVDSCIHALKKSDLQKDLTQRIFFYILSVLKESLIPSKAS